MRTLYEIISMVKGGQKPTYDELLYGLLAIDALYHFDRDFIITLPNKPNHQKHLEFWAEESFKRFNGALDKSPREWLGWDYDPANPEYCERQKIAVKLVERFIDRITDQDK